jgi:hypothetical protein
MNIMHRIILFMLVSILAACAENWQTTTASNDEDRDIGLGGTGMVADTGNGLGGTGIVGEITGFGSIFVNGIEIDYHEGTPFSIDGKPATMPELNIGDVVEVLTTDNHKHTQAQQINLRHEVIGQVTSVNNKDASFSVHGQTVYMPEYDTRLPAVGSNVAVFGIRLNKARIQATRIEKSQAGRKLLRQKIDLPYKSQVDRWLLQVHANQGQVMVGLDEKLHAVRVDTDKAAADKTESEVIELYKTGAGQLNLIRMMPHDNVFRGQTSYGRGRVPVNQGHEGMNGDRVQVPSIQKQSGAGAIKPQNQPQQNRR